MRLQRRKDDEIKALVESGAGLIEIDDSEADENDALDHKTKFFSSYLAFM